MRFPFLVAALFCASLIPAGAVAQTHSSELPPLTPDTRFPRCTERQLTVAGYPDHLHAHTWPDWQSPRDAAGQAYGPGSLCHRTKLLPTDELVSGPGEQRYRQFILRHNPAYEPCDLLGFVEILDWANHLVPALLGLATSDTLTVINPDNTKHYKSLTGQGVWRLYQLERNQAVIEPYPVLNSRTLDGHAGFMLITDWILHRALPQDLPPWLHQGLVEYIGEDGTHLFNYAAEFRVVGPVLFSPPLVDGILRRGVDPDDGADREMFRRACYSAYLMVWHLVENEGGLEAMRDFLGQVAEGADPDEACHSVYGVSLSTLAELLDPVRNGEPGGKDMPRQMPHRQP